MSTSTTGSIQTSPSGATYITGTVSGLNTQALINNAVNAKLIKKTRIEDQITTNANKVAAYQDLQDKMSSVQSSLNRLRSITTGDATNAFTDKQVSYLSSDSTTATNILSATVDGTAQTGSHKIIVTKLAQALTVTSDEQTSSTAALGFTGTFDIGETGKTAKTITVTATTSLQDIVNSINSSTSTSGVRADIIQASDGKFKLVISGNDTATNVSVSNVTGTDVLTSLGVTTSLGGAYKNISQDKQQAEVSVDGTTILSNSNTITNALTGFTLNLSNAAPTTTITVTIGDNTDGVKSAIQSFITNYNTLHDTLASYQAIGTDGTIPDSSYLYNDPITRTLTQSLNALISQTFGGGSTYQSLGAIGVTIDSRNDLSLDSTTLDTALKNNFSDVKALFATNGSTPGLADTVWDMLDSYSASGTGSYAKAITSLQALDTTLSAQANDIQTAADNYRQTLIEKYAKLETQMSQADILQRQIKAILQGSTQNNNN